MKKIIFSDCHWFSADKINIDPEYGAKVVYLGDNHEFKNVDTQFEHLYRKTYARFLERARSTNTIVIAGNHEVSVGNVLCGEYYVKENGVLYIHGHRLSYSKRKAEAWETREVGRGKLGRMMSKMLSRVRNLIPKRSISNKLLKAAYLKAVRHEVHTVVFGHTHVSKVVEGKMCGVRVINVPRGRTEIDV